MADAVNTTDTQDAAKSRHAETQESTAREAALLQAASSSLADAGRVISNAWGHILAGAPEAPANSPALADLAALVDTALRARDREQPQPLFGGRFAITTEAESAGPARSSIRMSRVGMALGIDPEEGRRFHIRVREIACRADAVLARRTANLPARLRLTFPPRRPDETPTQITATLGGHEGLTHIALALRQQLAPLGLWVRCERQTLYIVARDIGAAGSFHLAFDPPAASALGWTIRNGPNKGADAVLQIDGRPIAARGREINMVQGTTRMSLRLGPAMDAAGAEAVIIARGGFIVPVHLRESLGWVPSGPTGQSKALRVSLPKLDSQMLGTRQLTLWQLSAALAASRPLPHSAIVNTLAQAARQVMIPLTHVRFAAQALAAASAFATKLSERGREACDMTRTRRSSAA